METQKFDFLFKKGRNLILFFILICSQSAEITLTFVNISPTVANDTRMERFLRVGTYYSMITKKKGFYVFLKNMLM